MENKILLKHPAGKKAISMDKAKYDMLKKTILNYLKKKGEATHTEIWQSVTETFNKNGTSFQGSIQWHLEWVKLDLEANNIIRRVAETSPQKYAIAK